MADGLLFVYSDPGPVPAAEFNDWYDNEHGPARLTVPGITSGFRFHALNDVAPPWLAYYEFWQGTLDGPEYRALAENASAREKSIMSSVATLDRRVYELISDDWAPGGDDEPGEPDGLRDRQWCWRCRCPCRRPRRRTSRRGTPASTSRRCSRYPDGGGSGATGSSKEARRRTSRCPRSSQQRYSRSPAYQASVSTPRRNRLVELAVERERRVFGFHKAFG